MATTPFDLEVLRTRVTPDINGYGAALTALATGQVAWVVVSGKMCAGKDTVAPALTDLMPSPPVMLRYGNLMRAELDPALDVLRVNLIDGVGVAKTAVEIAGLIDLPVAYATELVTILAPEMAASGGRLTAHDRTEGVRRVLINLGDDWRCLDDEDYWARKAAQAALTELEAGNSVILTGGRFTPDVDLPRAAGGYLLRLDVTRQTQLDRLAGRDGLAPSAETLAALDHISETALDDYQHFDARIANDGDLADAIAASRAAFTADLADRGTRAA